MAKIGFIGLGIMGRPMALNLKAGGHELYVPDRASLTDEIRAAAHVVSDAAAVELLHEVVATPSLSRREGEVASLLVRRMSELGLRAHVDEVGNAVGVRGDDDAPRTIVLLGHMDTVPDTGWGKAGGESFIFLPSS